MTVQMPASSRAGMLLIVTALVLCAGSSLAQAQPLRVTGVSTCAAGNCHGGTAAVSPTGELTGVRGAEYTVWISRDPHAKAYSTLFSAKSRAIAERLWGNTKFAHTQNECLACHSLEFSKDRIYPGREDAVMTDGVSCEACHGPAEKWLAKHTQADFRQVGREWETALDPAVFANRFRESEALQATGLLNTDNLKTRGQQCLRCHVGPSHGYDMNHDLIAAGHPRLAFEYASYMSHLPAHWNTTAEKNVQPLHQARLWALGQALTVDASLELLAHRAGANAETSPPWPEFAENDCFACHHELGQQGRQKARASGVGSDGHNRWAAWSTALLPLVTEFTDTRELLADDGPFQLLKQEMRHDVPDRKKVVALVNSVRVATGSGGQKWETVLDRLNNDPDRGSIPLSTELVWMQLNKLLDSATTVRTASWDEWTQHYLAVRALHESLVRMDAPEMKAVDAAAVKATLNELRGRLMFGKSFESPHAFDSTEVQKLFAQLRSLYGGK